MNISAIKADITTLEVDAIVNAANELMLGGGGVDGAIHDAAGDELFEACLEIAEVRPRVRCPTGTCQITPGFNLKATWVIHTVGPVWRGGGNHEEPLLRSCYRKSLELAVEKDVSSIAFPAISCGVYRFPVRQAVKISIDEIASNLASLESNMSVVLVAFQPDVYEIMQQELVEFQTR